MVAKIFARSLFFVVVMGLGITALISTGCDKGGETSPETAQAVGTSKAELKKSYDEAGPEDCPTFAKELQDACKDIID
ncbi:MAG: hypothetical protein ACNA8W_25150, partial [Bradymonadaceae bacterium]